MSDLTKPVTEIDIAEAIRAADVYGNHFLTDILRRLAFERDRTNERIKELEKRAEGLADELGFYR